MFERKYTVNIGEKYGRLEVIDIKRVPIKAKRTQLMAYCKCECGNECIVDIPRLATGRKRSCGCLHHDVLEKRLTKHNGSGSRIYRVWIGMKERCYREKHRYFKHYGGRGITVCEEWRNSFEAFRDWALANGYTDELTIDRIDPNGNYEPSNCRWATAKEQANNRNNSIYVEYAGQKLTIAELSNVTGIPYSTIYFHNSNDEKEEFEKWILSQTKSNGIKLDCQG